MHIDTPIIIFAYAFPHRKSFDCISMVSGMGYRNFVVVAAPKITLPQNVKSDSKSIDSGNRFDVKLLCSSLNVKYVECPHDDVEEITRARNEVGAELAIIAGARILKANIIDIFPKGVINFHPGKIPETSGLDSFFYTLKSGSPMGVTVHFIDARVDAGKFIFFEKCPVQPSDTIESLKKRLYETQMRAIQRFFRLFFLTKIPATQIYRPKKNSPMTPAEKTAVREGFNAWKDQHAALCYENETKFFHACEEGRLEEVKRLVSESLYLIDLKNKSGWSAIIIAAYWQHESLVSYFLGMGANPNDRGQNGTTVLMYSKTRILDAVDPRLNIMTLLIASGASLIATDKFGKDIFFYLDVEKKSGSLIKNYLEAIKVRDLVLHSHPDEGVKTLNER